MQFLIAKHNYCLSQFSSLFLNSIFPCHVSNKHKHIIHRKRERENERISLYTRLIHQKTHSCIYAFHLLLTTRSTCLYEAEYKLEISLLGRHLIFTSFSLLLIYKHYFFCNNKYFLKREL